MCHAVMYHSPSEGARIKEYASRYELPFWPVAEESDRPLMEIREKEESNLRFEISRRKKQFLTAKETGNKEAVARN